MTQTEDRDLIRRALAGDQRAFEALYRAHRPRVYAIVVRRDRDEAEDLVQMTFVRAFQALKGFRGDAAFSTWLTQIALNVCASHLRTQQVRQVYEAAIVESLHPVERTCPHHESPEEAVFGRWRQERVRRGIQTLPPRYQEAVYLRYVQDRSYGEITRTLRVPMGTVKTWLCRARRQLKGEFRKSGLLAA
ncbi:MAG: sigma-70 family RNA polymerase sigma factor [Candidatus Latescibacteria bacterium]|nr:sigma-70 family RNA polymerase sigma factor [Candidatus Latescibacterota bacterium]